MGDQVKTVDQQRIYLTLVEAAQRLGVSRTTYHTLIAARLVPGVKVGRQWRIHPEALDAFIKTGRLDQKTYRPRPRTQANAPVQRGYARRKAWPLPPAHKNLH